MNSLTKSIDTLIGRFKSASDSSNAVAPGSGDRLKFMAECAQLALDRSWVRTAWFPTRWSRRQAECYFDSEGTTFGDAVALTGSDEKGMASVDLVTGYVGPLLIKIAGNVTTATGNGGDTTDPPAPESEGPPSDQKESIERFFAGGGTVTVSFVYPIKSWQAPDFMATIVASPIFGAEVPSFGSSAKSERANFDLGGDAHIRIGDPGLGVFGELRAAVVRGQRARMGELGIPDSSGFNYGRLSAGIVFGRKFMLRWTGLLWGPNALRAGGQRIGIGFIP